MKHLPLTRDFSDLEFVYVQSTGAIFLVDLEDGGAFIGRGYSGKGSAINSPDFEKVIATGPLPRGMWTIRPAIRHGRLGPVCLPLAPFGHDAHGRSGFYIHGDNKNQNFTASSGCIIANRHLREFIEFCRKHGCTRLRVEEFWFAD